MDYLHSVMNVREDQVVHVKLQGSAANIYLLDDLNFNRYQSRHEVKAQVGGYFVSSPVNLRPPWPGRWHVVVDLAGEPGEVNAALSLRPS